MSSCRRTSNVVGLACLAVLTALPADAAVLLRSEANHDGAFVTTRSSIDSFVAQTQAEWQAVGRLRRASADITSRSPTSDFATGFVEVDQTSGYGVIRSNAEISGFYTGSPSPSFPTSGVTNTVSVTGPLVVDLGPVPAGLSDVSLNLIFQTHGYLMLSGAANSHRASVAESVVVTELNTGQNNVVGFTGQITLTKTNDFLPRLVYQATGVYEDAVATPRSRTIFPGGQTLGPFAVDGYEVGDLHVLKLPLPAINDPTGLEFEITMQGIYETVAAGSFFAYAQADFRNTGLLGFSLTDSQGNELPLDGVTFMGQPVGRLPVIPEPAGAALAMIGVAALSLRRSRR